MQATVTIAGQQVSVSLWADSATGHAALAQTMSQLHSQLSDGTDHQVTVDLADFGSAQPDPRQAPERKRSGRHARPEAAADARLPCPTGIRSGGQAPLMGEPPGRPASVTMSTHRAPVFVVCNARSGSTLLRWLIDAHDEISCPGETDVAALLHAYVDSAQAAGLSIEDSLARARSVVDDLMAAHLSCHGKSRWCDKSLSNVAALDRLAEAWPEARFVLLHRHAMDVIASALEASEWGLDSFGLASYAQMSPTNGVIAVAGYWIERTAAMLDFEARHPGRCLRLRYEDLVTRTDESMEGVWRPLRHRWFPSPGRRLRRRARPAGTGGLQNLAHPRRPRRVDRSRCPHPARPPRYPRARLHEPAAGDARLRAGRHLLGERGRRPGGGRRRHP